MVFAGEGFASFPEDLAPTATILPPDNRHNRLIQLQKVYRFPLHLHRDPSRMTRALTVWLLRSKQLETEPLQPHESLNQRIPLRRNKPLDTEAPDRYHLSKWQHFCSISVALSSRQFRLSELCLLCGIALDGSVLCLIAPHRPKRMQSSMPSLLHSSYWARWVLEHLADI